jgi:hypothetical protein
MGHTLTHTTPNSRHYRTFTPDGSTHTSSDFIKAGLVTPNAHNIYTNRSLNNITSLASSKSLQANGADVSIKSKLT